MVTLGLSVRVNKRRMVRRSESTNPGHWSLEVDLARTELHIDGMAIDALTGQGFNAVEGPHATGGTHTT